VGAGRRPAPEAAAYPPPSIAPPPHFVHRVVSFATPQGSETIRTTLMAAPQEGQRTAVFSCVGPAVRRLTFSTTTGSVRPWLKVWGPKNGSKLRFPISLVCLCRDPQMCTDRAQRSNQRIAIAE
jgi:hypothetical protein